MEDLTLKFLTIGDASVGKTSITLRFAENDFPIATMPTIGIEYKTKNIILGGRAIKLQVWDTAGQERYHRTLSSTFYRRAHGIILVFDLNDRTSFEHVKNWMHQIQLKADKNVAVALVGNKSDLPRVVEFSEAEGLAASYGISFFATSAKTGDNISYLFERLCEISLANNPELLEEKKEPEGFLIPNKEPEVPKTKCC